MIWIRIYLFLIFLLTPMVCIAENDFHYTPSPEPGALRHCTQFQLGRGSITPAWYDYKNHDYIDIIKKKGAFLLISQIYGIDCENVFIAGSYRVGAGPVRSILLRSNDGGLNWIEAKVPRNFGYAQEILFLDREQGWLIETEILEGAGPASLFETKDGGITWKIVTRVLPGYPEGSWMTLRLEFSTHGLGSVWAEQPSKHPFRDDDSDFCKFTTEDGGKSWEETGVCHTCDTFFFDQKNSPVTNSLTDKSQWRINRYEAGLHFGEGDISRLFLIYRKMTPGHEWDLRIIIPADLKLEKGLCNEPYNYRGN